MDNLDLARAFDETGDLLELEGANPFRVRAYRNAARTFEDLVESARDLVAANPDALTELPGVGKDIAAKAVQLLQSGSFPLLLELRQKFPAGMLQMLRLPGMGPKKVALLHKELGISTLDELKAAAQAGKIAGIKGFGKKTEAAILAGMEQLAQLGNRCSILDARESADAIVADLLKVKGVKQASVAGSCRRRKETCGDLDVLATAKDSGPVMDRLANHQLVEAVLSRGETKQRVKLHNGLELDLRVVPEESFGAALQYFTGSKEHNIVIRQRGVSRGLKINEYGVYRGEELVAGRSEEDVYAAVDLPWIPPEIRENRGEIEAAEQGQVPTLVELSDIQGDLHMHTTATDGAATIRDMIQAAIARGLKYIAITDHSQRVSMANGLNADRLRAHWQEIRKVREEFDEIDVLLGVECDILENAEMDLPDDVLAEADWVLAVLHYGLKQPRDQIMLRLLNAVRNPHVDAIGHPSGRLISKRTAADIDYSELFKAAADHGVMMEINANPARLDLTDVQAAAARDRGIPIVINTDAHSTSGLHLMEYGVFQARRAGLTANDVANTRSAKEFRKLLGKR